MKAKGREQKNSRRLLISVDAVERRIALMDGSRLERLSIETVSEAVNRGNVFRGVIKRIEPSLQAAFVDYGGGRDGFLAVDEIHRNVYPPGVEGRAPIQKILKPRQVVLVQVTKDEVGTKGAALTTYVSLAGRFLVLMPDTERTGVSRKLSDQERQRIKSVIKEIELPDGFGVIARTAASTITKSDAARDLSYLVRLWQGIQSRCDEMNQPGLIYQESDSVIRFVRDHFDTDIDDVWIDDPDTFQDVLDVVSVLMPRQKRKVRLYRDEEPLFVRFGADEQIDMVFERSVALPSGGSLVFDETEALVAIDVNSGKTKERNPEETVLQANLEAAQEIAHQSQLRDLGGLLVIDFIDMKEAANRRKVETALRAAFKRDKARTRFGRLSTFGLLEMSRQRMGTSLHSRSFVPCEHCEGTGQVRTDASAALAVLRRISGAAAGTKSGFMQACLPPSLAHYLLNERRRELVAIERKTGTRIEILGDSKIVSRAVRFEYRRENDSGRRSTPAVLSAHVDENKGGRNGGQQSGTLSMYDPNLVSGGAGSDDLQGSAPDKDGRDQSRSRQSSSNKTRAPGVQEPQGRSAERSTPRAESPREREGAPERRPSDPVDREPQPEPSPSAGGDNKSPLRWLRRIFGAPETSDAKPASPAEPRHESRSRSIVVPVGLDAEESDASEESKTAAASKTSRAGDSPPARRGRRRGGRGRRKSGGVKAGAPQEQPSGGSDAAADGKAGQPGSAPEGAKPPAGKAAAGESEGGRRRSSPRPPAEAGRERGAAAAGPEPVPAPSKSDSPRDDAGAGVKEVSRPARPRARRRPRRAPRAETE